MGQTLSEPVTTKETSKCENSYAKVASSCMQGWRISILYNAPIIIGHKLDREVLFAYQYTVM